MSNIIEVRGLSKKFIIGEQSSPYLTIRESLQGILKKSNGSTESVSEFWALKGIDLNVKQGETLGIIGRNGAGKSTFLKILSKITPPTEGMIKLRGRVASLLEVGTGFHPELTGKENIFLNGSILGLSKKEIQAKFDEIVDFSGVSQFLDTPLKRFSSGMQLRLAFAVAAHLEPEILIIDEVLAVGDAEFQKKCLGKMGEVSKSGRTVIFVSHNMAAVNHLCSRCVLLKDGQIANMGDTGKIVEQYLESSGQVQDYHIDERKDRGGDGRVRIQSINFFDNTRNKELDLIMPGSDIRVEIDYKSADPSEKINTFNLGLAVFDSNQRFVTVLNSQMASSKFSGLPSEGKVNCRIKKFPLMQGTYYITATLLANGMVADQLVNACAIDVETGDYYQSGNPNDPGRQGTYIDQEWF